MHISLYPQQTTRPQGQAIWTTKDVTFDITFSLFAFIGWVACQQQMVPNKFVTGKHLCITPTNDLTHGVVGSGIGCIHAGMIGLSSVAVIGECAIHPAAFTVYGEPFRAVHFGRPQQVAGLSGFDQNLTLVGKTIGHGEWSTAVNQRQPSSTAIGIKLCYIQDTVV